MLLIKINTEAASQERLKTDEKFKTAAAAPSVKIEPRRREEFDEKTKSKWSRREKKNLQEVERLGSAFLLFFAHVAGVEMSFG